MLIDVIEKTKIKLIKNNISPPYSICLSPIFSKGLDFYADMIGLSAGYIHGKITKWVSQWAGDSVFPPKIGCESVSKETRRSIMENILNENRDS